MFPSPVAPCGNLWLLWIPALLHSNLKELLWNHLRTFTMKYVWFWKLPEVGVNPLLMLWNLEEFAVKPFAHFYKEILMVLEASRGCVNPLLIVWNLQEIAVKPCTHFCNEIFIVLEASGSCCESIIDCLDSREDCCEAMYTLLHWNINGFGSFRKLLWIH